MASGPGFDTTALDAWCARVGRRWEITDRFHVAIKGGPLDPADVADLRQHIPANYAYTFTTVVGDEDQNDNLVSFLYILLRDHLPAGEVEGIMTRHVEVPGELVCSNKHLEAYARELAARILTTAKVEE